MSKTSTSKAKSTARRPVKGQFWSVVSALKPATRQASISLSQAEKAVKSYLSAAK